MIYALIVTTEVAFWFFLLAGLLSRYILKRRRLGTALLAATPLVDLVLLTAAVVDIRRGAEADTRHALAAIYLGVSIAFGHRIITWADGQFAHQFAGGPKPPGGPKYGPEHARAERSGWYRHLLAWTIAAAVLGFIHLVGGNRDETRQLFGVLGGWAVVLAIDFVWSFSYTFFPRRPPAGGPGTIGGTAARPPVDPPATEPVSPATGDQVGAANGGGGGVGRRGRVSGTGVAPRG